MMKRCLMLVVAALVLASTAPSAFALARHVIFDPLPPATLCTANSPCNIQSLDTPYAVQFQSCSNLPPAEAGAVADNHATWCLWMNNVSVSSAVTFTFEFAVPTGEVAGTTLDCSSFPSTLATNNCPTILPAAGESLTFAFFAHPPLATNLDFYMLTDFTNSPGSAIATLSIPESVPEPTELGLFGLGLLVIGLEVVRRRRGISRRGEVARR